MTGSAMSAFRWPRPFVALCLWVMVAAMPARAADCEMSLSTPQVDFGRVSRATMVAAGDAWLLPSRTVALTVRCPEPRDMTLRFRAAPADAREFRLAEHARLALHVHDGLLDGQAVELGQGDGQVATAIGKGAWLPDQGLAPFKGGHVATGRVFNAQIDLQPRVDNRAWNVGDTRPWSFVGLIEAVAANVAQELSLQASLQTGSCQVDVMRHVSFGRLRQSDLDDLGRSTRVPATQAGQLRVVCDGPMLVAFRVPHDERAGTAAIPRDAGLPYDDDQWFGLGKTSAGQNIGAYALRWASQASSDQGELQAIRSPDGGRSWTATGGSLLAEHDGAERVGYAGSRDAANGPLPVSTLSVTLDAEIYIAPRHTLSFHDEVEADGLATFEIVY